MSNLIYAEPRAYDLAFSYRDYTQEVSELTGWYQEVSSNNQPPESVLELACGPARHLLEFSRSGIRARGIDTSDDMCAYANSLIQAGPLDPCIEVADMTAFELGEKFDLILLMLNSVSHILDEESLRSHFHSVNAHLRDHGVYIVESSRSDPTERYVEHVWRESDPTGSVSVNWRCEPGRDIARIAGIVNGVSVDIHDDFPMRRWATQELLDVARDAGLAFSGHYGDFSSDMAEELSGAKKIRGGGELHPCFVFSKGSHD